MRKKGMLFITVLAMLMISVVGLAACDNNADKFTVTFVSNGGSAAEAKEVEKDKSIDLPTTTRDGYIFEGWYDNAALGGERLASPYTPESDVTLYAKWIEETDGYTVTFMNGDKVFYTTQVEEGNSAKAPEEIPTKESDEQYDYTFSKWDKSFDNVQEDLIINAVFTRTLRKFTVTFMNGDKVFYTTQVEEGNSAKAPEEIPTKESDEQYDYTFSKWDKSFDNVQEDLIINAVFTRTLRKFTVTFMNGDTEYSTPKVSYGNQVVQPAKNPVKQPTETEEFTFSGWYLDIDTTRLYDFGTSVSGEFTLYAGYTSAPKSTFVYALNTDGKSYTVSKPKDKTITTAVIPETYNNLPVTGIATKAFYECESLEKITAPSCVTSIGAWAFKGTPLLADAPDGVMYVGKVAYEYIGDMPEGNTVIRLNSDTKGIADKAFDYSSLTEIILPDGIVTIGENALSASDLKKVTIPSSVSLIKNNAFASCKGLTSINIPLGIIGDAAFSACTNLDSVTIGRYVTSIGNNPFTLCSRGLSSITVAAGNPTYHSAGNCLIQTAEKRLITGSNTSVIPNDGSVTAICESAFYGCDQLESITIPEGVTRIDNAAFYRCVMLKTITLPKSLTEIGGNVFNSINIYGPLSIKYSGSEADWALINKDPSWDKQCSYGIKYSDENA